MTYTKFNLFLKVPPPEPPKSRSPSIPRMLQESIDEGLSEYNWKIEREETHALNKHGNEFSLSKHEYSPNKHEYSPNKHEYSPQHEEYSPPKHIEYNSKHNNEFSTKHNEYTTKHTNEYTKHNEYSRKTSHDVLSRESALNERYFEQTSDKVRSRSLDNLLGDNPAPQTKNLNDLGLSQSRLNDRYHSVERLGGAPSVTSSKGNFV